MKMMNSKKHLISAIIFNALLCFSFGQSFDELYKNGLKLYEQNNYDQAEICFKEALKYGEKKDTIYFLLGMCSAFQNRLEEAESHFLTALGLNNRYEECYLELGGIYFKKKEYQKAERMIKKALKFNPANEYSRDFLGTLYFISGLTIQALHEWNKINKPVLANLSIENNKLKKKELISNELRFNPGQMIKPSMIRESQKRLEKIGNISNVSFNLIPYQESPEDFNLVFSCYELSGFGENFGFFLINSLKNITLKTLHLDYKNIFNRNINVYGSYRFNSLRKKSQVLITFPRFSGWPLYASLAYTNRNEIWSLPDFQPGQERREERITTREFIIRFDYIHDHKISYNQFLKFKTRNVSDNPIPNKSEKNLFSSEVKNLYSFGGEFKLNLNHNLPKYIFSDLSVAYALFSQRESNRSPFIKLWLTLENRKLWRKTLSDEVKGNLLWRLSLGHSSTEIPLEDRFMLGIGPDIQYYLRAHSSTDEGKLGNSPIATGFILSNLEYSHYLFQLFPFKIEGGTFIDCARIFGENSLNYKDEFIVDFGVFLKIYLFKFPFILSYGHNFKENINSVYIGSHLRF
jgi:tetratricopeptide (TPR) repeat protein